MSQELRYHLKLLPAATTKVTEEFSTISLSLNLVVTLSKKSLTVHDVI
jgi:hypothetical protein